MPARRCFFLGILFLAVLGPAWGWAAMAAAQTIDRPTGRDLAENDPTVQIIMKNGVLTSLSGSLEKNGAVWVLEAEEGTYELFLTRRQRYITQDGANLQEGAIASVKGFVLEKRIAVTEIRLGGHAARPARPVQSGPRPPNGGGPGAGKLKNR